LPEQQPELLQGTLDMLILKVLANGEMHGFGISRRIHEISQDLLRVEQGSLYPALYRLEENGWIRSEWGISDNNRKAKFYSLTRTGKKQLDRELQSWNRLSAGIRLILESA
jgi:PadR family transcriptional regulator PadR